MQRTQLVLLTAVLACGDDPTAAGPDPDSSAGSSGGPGSSPTATSDPASTGESSSLSSAQDSSGAADTGSSVGSSEGAGSESTGEPPPPRDAIAVAVGYGTRRVRSLDGLTWTDFVEVDPNGGDDDNLLRGVGWGDGVFVAVGGGGNGFSMRSLDGIVWQDEVHELDGFLSDVAYLDGVFVAAGGNGLRLRSLDAGVSWQDQTPYFAGHYRAIAAGNGIAVAIGHTYGDTNVGLVATTSDGASWSAEQMIGAAHSGGCLAFGGGVFVARDDAGDLRSSSDGLAWSEVVLDLEGSGAVLRAEARFVTAGDGVYWVSDDGARWSELASPTVRTPVGWLDGHYLTLGWPATIDASDDLLAWENVFAPGGSGLTDIAVGSPS
jgi:hypothetical protein